MDKGGRASGAVSPWGVQGGVAERSQAASEERDHQGARTFAEEGFCGNRRFQLCIDFFFLLSVLPLFYFIKSKNGKLFDLDPTSHFPVKP